MNMVLLSLMKHVGHRFKQIQRTGKELLEKLVDGSILKMIIRLWILILWKACGGYLKNCGKKI